MATSFAEADVAIFLGLDNSDGRCVDEEEIVGLAMPGFQRKLSHGHASAGGQVG